MIVFTSHLQRGGVVVKFCGIAIGILLHPKKLENGKASCKPFKDLLIHFGFFTIKRYFSHPQLTFGIHTELGQFVRVPNIFSIDRSSLGGP